MKAVLYSFVPQDRSGKIRWLLEELEVPYEIKKLDGESGEHKEADFTSVSPMGLVPVLKYGAVTLFESAAIALYLTENIANGKNFAPGKESSYRADFLKWLVYASTTLDPLLFKVFKTRTMTEEEKGRHLESVSADFRETANQLHDILSESHFIIGGEFSAADIMMAQPLNWANKKGLLENYPILMDYLERLKQRPACIASGVFQN